MGVTIHFEGRVGDDSSLDKTVALARAFAEEHDWPVEEIQESNKTLQRIEGEEDHDYVGPVRGLRIQPHPNSDPLWLEFDEEFFVQDFIKTQFAGVELHLQVIALFEQLEPFFETLRIEDEGEFLETRDMNRLERHFSSCFDALSDYLTEHPSARGPVRTTDGRILDAQD